MNIKFTGEVIKNQNFGVTFQALVNDNSVSCVVSQEALQDIDSDNELNDLLEKFNANQNKFESIAKQKILNDEISDGKLFIAAKDL